MPLTLTQARAFLLRFGEAGEVPYSAVGKALGFSGGSASVQRDCAIKKIVAFLKDPESLAKAARHPEGKKEARKPARNEPRSYKPRGQKAREEKSVFSGNLELAQAVWNDRLFVTLHIYLGELMGLLVHPSQLALALKFNSRESIGKDVFPFYFSGENVRSVAETAAALGRTKKEVSNAKNRVLRLVARRLRKILENSQPEEVFSVRLTQGFSRLAYLGQRFKQAETMSLDPEIRAKRKYRRLEKLSNIELQGRALAIIQALEQRGLGDWLLVPLGLEPVKGVEVEEIKITPKAEDFSPVLKPLPELSATPVGVGPAAEEPLPNDLAVYHCGKSLASRLLACQDFCGGLGINILPEKLREILPKLDKIVYFRERKLKPNKILELRYLGEGKGKKPLSKQKIGEKFGGYTNPSVVDWLRRIFAEIRRLAQE